MFDLTIISNLLAPLKQPSVTPTATIPQPIADFINPCKELPVTPEMEAKRLELLSDPVFVMDIVQWIGWTLEDVWVDSRKAYDKIWNKWNAAIISWLTTGTVPNDISFPSKHAMRDTLLWWTQAPAPIKDLVEPIVEHWKIWAYYPWPTWEYQYDPEKVVYVPEGLSS